MALVRLGRACLGTEMQKGSPTVRRLAVLVLGASIITASGCGSDPNVIRMQSTPAPCTAGSNFVPASVPLIELSCDSFTNSSSQHRTEVEPGSFAFGNTMIASFQVGRIFAGGASDIGYAISTDGGGTWNRGLLPGITTFEGSGA